MSNWPLVAATRYETLGAGTGVGTTLTSGAANTKGAYATIGTTGFRWSGLMLSMMVSNTADRYRIDIAIDGTPDLIVEDLFIDAAFSTNVPIFIPLPVKVPSGAVVKARIQALGSGRTATMMLTGYVEDTPGLIGGSRMVSLTDFTSTLPTNSVVQTGQAFTAWTQIVASTKARVSQLMVSTTGYGDTTRTASDFIIDIGVGGSGSEKSLFQFLGKNNTATMGGGMFQAPCDIPVSSRLSFRCQCAQSAAADSIGVAAMGIAA